MNNTNNKGILRQLVPLLVVSGVFLSSCSLTGGSSVDGGSSSPSSYDSTATDSTNDVPYTSAGDSVTSGDYTSEEGDVSISLSDGASNSSGSGVSIDNANNLITISSLGTYVISGSLSNGSIYVNASKIDDDNDTVELVLNGASITSKGNASVVVSNVTVALGPIYSSSSSKLHIKCASGSTNVIVDSRASSSTVGDDSAAIFSNKLLRIKGSGSLKVTSTFNNGLASDTKVKAAKATCSVSAPNNAIKAHEAVVLGGYEDQGSFTLTFTGTDNHCIRVDDATYSVATPVYGNTETDDDIAGIEIKDGAYVLSSLGNAISSEAYAYLVGGNGTISSTAGKGVSAVGDITVAGGNFSITSKKDDCIHSSSNALILNGGTYSLTSGTSDGCQGLKGESSVTINGGRYVINSSYEGIAAHQIIANGGTTIVTANDDGWSAGGTSSQSSSNCKININGGSHYVNAGGDGMDSNGYFVISGGTVIVAAPSSGGNSPLDSGDGYNLTINGGDVVAYGITGMTESVTGTQNSVVLSSCTSVSSGNYLVFKVGDSYLATKINRNLSTVTSSFSSYGASAYDIGYASSVSVSETIFEEGCFYKVTSPTYTSFGTSGTFSASANCHIGGNSQTGPGTGGTGGGGHGGGR